MSCHRADTEPVNHEWRRHEKAASADEPLIKRQHLYPPALINRHFCGYLLFINRMHLSLFAWSTWVESIFIFSREPTCELYVWVCISPLEMKVK